MIIWTPKQSPKRRGGKPEPRGPMATRKSAESTANIRSRVLAVLPWAAGVCIGAGVIAASWWGWHQLPKMPVQQVVVRGDLKQVDAAALAHAVLPSGQDLMTLNLQEVRARAKAVPWVREVEVRRVPPDRVELTVEEHQPLARWQDVAAPDAGPQLVNRQGEVFAASLDARMPLLAGPTGTAHEVVSEAARFATVLGELPAEVRLSARRAWHILLADGTRIDLGRNDVMLRLERYVRVRTEVAGLRATGLRVDLRYPNGLAVVKTPEMLQQEKDMAQRKKKT